ncbi:hypothetical protein B0H12DRAFT_1069136 [Mycena haematopus]|nr:hypothetical protein B0H12DRAFT_1069136 [Mycena haematopus]
MPNDREKVIPNAVKSAIVALDFKVQLPWLLRATWDIMLTTNDEYPDSSLSLGELGIIMRALERLLRDRAIDAQLARIAEDGMVVYEADGNRDTFFEQLKGADGFRCDAVGRFARPDRRARPTDTLFPPTALADGSIPTGDFYRPVLGKRPLVPKHGNSHSVQLVLDAMKLPPCRPNFFEARDAIILADQQLTGGEDFCPLWKGFSSRVLGPTRTPSCARRALEGSGLMTSRFRSRVTRRVQWV